VVAALLGGIAQSNLQTPLCAVILLAAISLLVCPVTAAAQRHTAASISLRLGIVAFVVVVSAAAYLRMAAVSVQAAGVHLAERGRYEDSVATLRRARMLNPFDATTDSLIGDIYSEANLRTADARYLLAAEAHYLAATRLDPDAGMLSCKVADLRERQDDPTGALAWYLRACGQDWFKASYHLQAGRLATQLGFVPEATRELRSAIRLFPLWITFTRIRGDPGGVDALMAAQDDAWERYERLIARYGSGLGEDVR
jgi:tetratricopeptide (TPR) repeat protein